MRLFILFMLMCNMCFGAEQLITSFEDTDVPILNEELRKLTSSISSVNSTVNGLSIVRVPIWVIDGDIETVVETTGRFKVPFTGAITQAIGYAKTAPTGSSILFDVNINGSTIWSTQANRLAIAAGANEGTQGSFNNAQIDIDDVLTLDVDQVGSSTAGVDITVELYITELL